MGRLVYSLIGSLDGRVADVDGDFGWAEPDEEVLAFVNERERSVGTYMYGRRMYELMIPWEADPDLAASSPGSSAFAEIWKAADKVVYSTTLTEVSTARTQLRSSFEVEEIRSWKAAARSDLNIAGPTLAEHAFRAGLVDELQIYLTPVLIGSGLSLFPHVRQPLTLIDQRRFGHGTVWLRYEVSTD